MCVHEYLQNECIPFRNNIKSIAYEKRVFTPWTIW